MSSDSVQSIFVRASSAANASARADLEPSRSPKSRRCSGSAWNTVPSGRSITLIWQVPPRTLSLPKRASRRSRWAMPFSIGSSTQAPCIAGATASIAESRS